MLRILIIVCAALALLYLGACAVLYAFQRSLIYYPQPRSVGTPATILKLPVADADVLVSVRPHDGPEALLYFGGNAEDVSGTCPRFRRPFRTTPSTCSTTEATAAAPGSPPKKQSSATRSPCSTGCTPTTLGSR